MVEGGPWRNFDEIEDSLILDELLLLVEAMTRKQKNQFRMMAAVQGIDVPVDESEVIDLGDSDLPEELLEAEREYQKKKQEKLNRGDIKNDLGLGIGYEGSPIIVDQLGL